MKIAVCSDIHNEFDIWNPNNNESADVLILAGDIVVATLLEIDDKRTKQNLKFFEKCSKLYKNVIYILGNHEYYHGDFKFVYNKIKEKLGAFPNIHVLNNELIHLEDVVFLGTTLWTNCDNENPEYMWQIANAMNDFYYIKNGVVRFTVEDSIEEFKKSFKFLRDNLSKFKNKKCVVITHHSPTYKSIAQKYKYQYGINSAYASNLDQFILDRPQIKYWVYGHSHIPNEITIGDCIVLNNARGYVGSERKEDKYQPYYPKIIEI